MSYRGLLVLGGIEIANSNRAATYVEGGLRPKGMEISHDDSWRHTARFLGQAEYRLPHLDAAPWYDPLEADSKLFAGVWPMQITGLDGTQFTRQAIEGLNDGGVFGLPRYPMRTIKVEALLVGQTPQAVDYGFRWLTTALRGSRCMGPSMGETLQFLGSCPDAVDNLSAADFEACVAPYRRSLHEVVCTSTPEITDRFGGVGDGQPGVCGYRVSFELTAGVPFAYRDRTVIAANVKWAGSVSPITWVVQSADPEACASPVPDTLVDPTVTRATVIRPSDTYQLGTVIPLDSKTATINVPASNVRAKQGDLATQLEIVAGAQDERLIRIRWGRKPVAGMTNDQAIRCHLISEANVSYLPAGARLNLDGVTGRAWAVDAAGNKIDASPVVSGINGGPWRPPVLACANDYVIVADASGDISTSATINVWGSVRET